MFEYKITANQPESPLPAGGTAKQQARAITSEIASLRRDTRQPEEKVLALLALWEERRAVFNGIDLAALLYCLSENCQLYR